MANQEIYNADKAREVKEIEKAAKEVRNNSNSMGFKL